MRAVRTVWRAPCGPARSAETAFRFRVSPSILLAGIVFALLMGAIGGLLPARMAANKEILTALREI